MRTSEVYIVKPNAKPQRTQPNNICTWLRQRTSGLNYGMKTGKKKYPRANTNRDIIAALNDPDQWRRIRKLKNCDYQDHFFYRQTYFAEGQGWDKFPETLFCLDIDCHKSGSLEGATAFARYLKKKYFPGLYMEVSTEGNGLHCYMVLQKQGHDAHFINKTLKQLEKRLQNILFSFNFDVENIEVKGTLPELVWSSEKGVLSNYKSGQQVKLPREHCRFEQLKNTTQLSMAELQEFVSENVMDRSSLPPILGGDGTSLGQMPWLGETVRPGEAGETAEKNVKGSFEGKIFHQGEMQKLEQYRLIARKLMEHHKMTTTNRSVVTVEDMAVFLMLGKWFTKNMNEDGSLPTARWKGMWSSLSQAGDIERAWNPNRFTAIRQFFSSLGLLSWEDEEYERGWTTGNGHYVKGRAAKWCFSAEMMGMLEAEEEKGGRERPFIITPILPFIENLRQSSEAETIRPVSAVESIIYLFNAEEIGQFHSYFELAA